MKTINDEEIRSIFEEQDNNALPPAFIDSERWRSLHSYFPERKTFSIRWYQIAVAVVLMAISIGWAITYHKNSRLMLLNDQLLILIRERNIEIFGNQEESTFSTVKLQEEFFRSKKAHNRKTELAVKRKPMILSFDSLKISLEPFTSLSDESSVEKKRSLEREKDEIPKEDLHVVKNSEADFIFSGISKPAIVLPQKQVGRRIKIQFLSAEDPLMKDSDQKGSRFRIP